MPTAVEVNTVTVRLRLDNTGGQHETGVGVDAGA